MIEDYFFTKNTKWVLWGAVALVGALLIFHAGVVVGSHQRMPSRMGENPNGMLGGFMPNHAYVESGHGAVGTIATVTLPTFIITGRDGTTQVVETSSSTVVTGGESGSASDIATGRLVIIIGDPRQTDAESDLDARIIHILPPPPAR